MMTVEPRSGVTPYQQRDGAPVFLSDMIMELGLAEQAHVEAAVETARSSGETVGRVLIREGRLTADDLARALAARYGLSHIDLEKFEVNSAAANLLPPAAARRYRAVPLDFEPEGALLVAMADPSDSLALNDIAFMTKLEVHAAVAAENLIADLVGRLPLARSEASSSGFPTPAPPPMRIPDAPPMPEQAGPPPPAIEPLGAEFDETPAELARAQADLQRTADELLRKSNELDHSRSELGHKNGELERARSELAQKGGELEQARTELDQNRAELDQNRSELEKARTELSGARSELDQNRAELEKAQAEVARASEALGRLDELDEAEARVHEAHATVERMRNEFEIEREQYATTERALRARLASESEQHEALQEAQGALQKRVDALRAQNAALLDAYATAKRWSAEFARGARELANTLEQPVLDDAVRAQQPAADTPPPAPPPEEPRREGPTRFTRENGDDVPPGGGTPPPDWLN